MNRPGTVITTVYTFIELGEDEYEFKEYKALWDTGATRSSISENVIKSYDSYSSYIKKRGKVEVYSIDGNHKFDEYDIGIIVSNSMSPIKIFPYMNNIEMDDFDVIIGMDIIQTGIFKLEYGKLTFTE